MSPEETFDDLAFEHDVRRALRYATAGIDAPRDAAAAARTGARARRRRNQWTAVLAAVLAVAVAASAATWTTRGRHTGSAAVTSGPSPAPTAPAVVPTGWLGGRGFAVGGGPFISVGWLPPSVDWYGDDVGVGVDHASTSLRDRFFRGEDPGYRDGIASSEGFGAPDGHSGVLVEALTPSRDPLVHRVSDLSQLIVGGRPARATPAGVVSGHPAVILHGSDPAMLYLAWIQQPSLTIVVGVTTPMFDEAVARRMAESVILTGVTREEEIDTAADGPARSAVLATYAAAYSLDAARTPGAVVDGDSLRPVLTRLARTRPDLVGPLVFVPGSGLEGLHFTSPTRAMVAGMLRSSRPGGPSTYVNSSAVWTPTGWKIPRNGVCNALKRLGVGTCP